MRLSGSVKVDLTSIKELRQRTMSDSAESIAWKKRSAQKVRSFWYKRFNKFSRGAGNWKSTKRRRASKKKKGKPLILRMTHTLYRALSPVYRGLPGQYERIDGSRIVTGYGGGAKHPRAKLSVVRLATIHNNGLGRNVQRKIIVSPTSDVRRRVVSDYDRKVASKSG